MNKLLPLTDLSKTMTSLHKRKQKIVLAGGCFDILHPGHLAFLEHAKAKGDCLLILLESDVSIRNRKGEGKPIHSQKVRASILAAVKAVDYIVLLPGMMTHAEYDNVVLIVKPAIIATTKGDSGIEHKKRQAALLGADVCEVIERLPEHASSTLAKHILNT